MGLPQHPVDELRRHMGLPSLAINIGEKKRRAAASEKPPADFESYKAKAEAWFSPSAGDNMFVRFIYCVLLTCGMFGTLGV